MCDHAHVHTILMKRKDTWNKPLLLIYIVKSEKKSDFPIHIPNMNIHINGISILKNNLIIKYHMQILIF